MHIHCILGTTGVGKTAVATAQARRLSAPVLVLDRIQIHGDLAISSGRPDAAEVEGTERHYLAERPLCDGEMTAEEGLYLVYAQLARLRQRPAVVIEGGSCSIIRLLTAHGFLGLAHVTVEWRTIPDLYSYRERVSRRVSAMFAAGMVDEVCDAATDPAAYANLQTTVGPNALLAWTERAGRTLADLRQAAADPAERANLIHLVVQSHVRYANQQEACWQAIRHEIETPAATPARPLLAQVPFVVAAS